MAIDCAALPEGLVESELFGYERGAFAGALSRAPGKAVDVRLLAATNQDLPQSIQDGRFRADLFYRLSVFPIQLPATRDRREDMPRLVSHFVERFADQLHKRVSTQTKSPIAKATR